MRRKLTVVREGNYREFKRMSRTLYAYAREMEGQRLLVVCSFAKHTTYFSAPMSYDLAEGTLCLCGYEDAPTEGNGFFLRPYECRVYLWE